MELRQCCNENSGKTGTNRMSIRRNQAYIIEILLVIVLMLIGGIGPSFAAEQADPSTPTTMQKIVVRYESPDVDPNSYAAKPRTYYRAGDIYGRIEQSLNDTNGIQPLVVISAPDQWVINAFNHTGQHTLDTGIPSIARLPVLPPGQKSFLDLEFGHELEYFKNKGA